MIKNTMRRMLSEIAGKSQVSIQKARAFESKTEGNILTSPFEPVPTSNETLVDFIWQNLDKYSERTATVCAVTGRGYTYAQEYKMSMTFAASLRSKLRLETLDTTFVVLRNCPEAQIIFMGIVQAGGVASMSDPSNTTQNFKHQLKLIDPKLIITEKLFYPKIREALKELSKNVPVILTDEADLPEGTIKFSEFATDQHIELNCLKSVFSSKNDIVCLPFSSGTTGLPKAVMLSHYALVNLTKMSNHEEYRAVNGNYEEHQAIVPAILPFFHVFGLLAHVIYSIYYGAKLVTMPQFMPDVFLDTLIKHRPDVMIAVPPLVSFMANNSLVTKEHVASIKDVVIGGAPLRKVDFTAYKDKNKNVMLRQGYGLTETAGGISLVLKSDTANDKGDSVGTPVRGGEIQVVDEDTKETLERGKEGELWVRGPFLMSGYYKNDEATKEVLTKDGWFKTGDIGKLGDKDFYITGRLKELIKVKGYQVPPAELENIILTHPKVTDCAVIGIPDPITGEVPKAFVVTDDDQPLTKAELMDFVNAKLVKYKHLKSVEFIDEIPKTPAGKILRKDLRNM